MQDFKNQNDSVNLFKVPVSSKKAEDESFNACEEAFIQPDSQADLV